jgi:dephospho-CoA kinase
MIKLGLTGSIATGKSTVLAAFGAAGVPIFSADAAVHELYAGAAVAPIEAEFPGVARNGTIDRAELARRLIGNPERLRVLEAIVHPLVRQKVARFLADAEAEGAELAVVESRCFSKTVSTGALTLSSSPG